jgi:hypothetical protein
MASPIQIRRTSASQDPGSTGVQLAGHSREAGPQTTPWRMVKPSASRGWPLAAQPGRVTVSTRSNAFSERCATEHGGRESPE